MDSLRWLRSNNNIESEEPDSIPEDDYDDTKESADGISAPWDDTISWFLLL